jgi:hypothetical protein
MSKLRILMLTAVALVAIAVPVAAQSPAVASAVRHPRLALARVARNFAFRIHQGVRANEISPAERARLRSEMLELRTEVRGLRQAGTPPTAEQRAAVREAVRKISRDIYAARHGEFADTPR